MRTRTTKRIAGASAALLLAGTVAACGGEAEGDEAPAGDELTTVTAMMFPGQSYRLPVMLAEQEGMFAEHGIELAVVDQPGNITGTQGMKATGADVGHLSGPTVVQGWQAGDEFPFFCGGINVTQTTMIAATDSDLPSMEEGHTWQEVLQGFEGKKIGIQHPVGSGMQLLFAEALSEAGVTDVDYVNLGGTPTLTQAALDNGSIDVAQINPPGTQLLASEGYGKPLIYMLEGPSVYAEYYGSGLVASPEWLEEYPDLAQGFCDAQTEALEFIADPANEEAAVSLLSEDTGIPEAAATLVVQNVYQDFSTELDDATMQKTFDAYVELGIAKPDPAPTTDALIVRPQG